jgi:hypothetical protein
MGKRLFESFAVGVIIFLVDWRKGFESGDQRFDTVFEGGGGFGAEGAVEDGVFSLHWCWWRGVVVRGCGWFAAVVRVVIFVVGILERGLGRVVVDVLTRPGQIGCVGVWVRWCTAWVWALVRLLHPNILNRVVALRAIDGACIVAVVRGIIHG